MHAASYTEPSWPWYGRLVGVRFAWHPPGTSTASVAVTDPGHPATASLPAQWVRDDEWYTFEAVQPGLRVLLTTGILGLTPRRE